MNPVEQISRAGQPFRFRRFWLLAELVAWAFGAAALAIWCAAHLAGIAGTRHDLERFQTIRAAAFRPAASIPEPATPDLSLWSPGRVRAWRAVLAQPGPPPLAILRIPKIQLEVPVLPGTDTFVLNRAVGHIENTALPGTNSNAGIAGHRDGFFRGLKEIAAGDAIELETLAGRQVYHVARTWIVDQDDTSALQPTLVRSLTLVTCYPFYFVGSAPQRFVVRAVLADDGISVSRR